jgi:3-oxoacyl-[acyl-carrier-protein] synthase III
MVTHQPVAWAGNAWRECIGIPESKFYESFKKYGNIATAAVPTNLLEAIELRRISAGDNVIFASPGAGENHICIIMKISPELVDYIHNVHAHAHAVNGKDRMVPTPQKAFE